MIRFITGGIVLGIELEYKLHITDQTELERVLVSEEIEAVRITPWKETRMKTTYFDTADRRFSERHWTLRHRTENGIGIVCLKTPLPDRCARGEWQIEADAPSLDAIERLLQCGAPQELLWMYGDGQLFPVCGAEFLRKSAMLQFFDGSRAEAAGDCGRLFGPTETLPFVELELELYHGTAEATKALVSALCRTYGLHEEPLSKVARARRLK